MPLRVLPHFREHEAMIVVMCLIGKFYLGLMGLVLPE